MAQRIRSQWLTRATCFGSVARSSTGFQWRLRRSSAAAVERSVGVGLSSSGRLWRSQQQLGGFATAVLQRARQWRSGFDNVAILKPDDGARILPMACSSQGSSGGLRGLQPPLAGSDPKMGLDLLRQCQRQLHAPRTFLAETTGPAAPLQGTPQQAWVGWVVGRPSVEQAHGSAWRPAAVSFGGATYTIAASQGLAVSGISQDP